MRTSKKLNPRQERFVKEYLLDLNASQAAIRSGYSPRTAGAIGEENLKKPEIKKAIDKALAERSARTEIDADRVVQEIGTIAFAKVGKIKAADKIRALELLGKHLGMFVKKFEITEQRGGVLLVPSPVSPEEWSKAAAEHQRRLEAEAKAEE
ncbi:MAG: terminase small subunit [Candidatus Omnitrophota bacterium]